MSEKSTDNEREACEAVARSLEELAHAKRSNPRRPERDGGGAPVDYLFDLVGRTVAIEHTVIEAFARQIHTGVDFSAFVTPIQDALDRRLPSPGMYRLLFPIDPSAGIKPREIARAQVAIVAWTKEKAAELYAEYPGLPTKVRKPRSHTNFRKGRIDGFAFDLHLERETGEWMRDMEMGRLFVARYAPADYEELRRKRIEITLDKKLPKLAAWKAKGSYSVLVLENRDMALTHRGKVADALEEKLEGRTDKPDEIWLVDTTIATEWTVWRLMSGDVWFPDEKAPIRYRSFNPPDLSDELAKGV